MNIVSTVALKVNLRDSKSSLAAGSWWHKAVKGNTDVEASL